MPPAAANELKENLEKVEVPLLENVSMEIVCPSTSKPNEEVGPFEPIHPSQSQLQSTKNVGSVVYGDEYLSIEE